MIRIKDTFLSRKGHEKLVDLKKISFGKLFSDFLKENKYFVDDTEKKYLECNIPSYDKDKDTYYGIIGYGDFGYSSEIINVRSKKITKYKTIEETEKLPFYYLLKVFQDYAILLISQFKRRGIKERLNVELGKFLIKKKKIGAGYISLKIDPVMDYDTSNIKNIECVKFVRRRTPKDVERQVFKDLNLGGDLKDFVEEKRIQIKDEKFPLFKFLNKLKRLSQNNSLKKYMRIDGETYETLKIDTIMEDGRSKVITVEKGLRFTEGMEENFEGNFPSLDKFYKKVRSYFDRVIKNV